MKLWDTISAQTQGCESFFGSAQSWGWKNGRQFSTQRPRATRKKWNLILLPVFSPRINRTKTHSCRYSEAILEENLRIALRRQSLDITFCVSSAPEPCLPAALLGGNRRRGRDRGGSDAALRGFRTTGCRPLPAWSQTLKALRTQARLCRTSSPSVISNSCTRLGVCLGGATTSCERWVAA